MRLRGAAGDCRYCPEHHVASCLAMAEWIRSNTSLGRGRPSYNSACPCRSGALAAIWAVEPSRHRAEGGPPTRARHPCGSGALAAIWAVEALRQSGRGRPSYKGTAPLWERRPRRDLGGGTFTASGRGRPSYNSARPCRSGALAAIWAVEPSRHRAGGGPPTTARAPVGAAPSPRFGRWKHYGNRAGGGPPPSCGSGALAAIWAVEALRQSGRGRPSYNSARPCRSTHKGQAVVVMPMNWQQPRTGAFMPSGCSPRCNEGAIPVQYAHVNCTLTRSPRLAGMAIALARSTGLAMASGWATSPRRHS